MRAQPTVASGFGTRLWLLLLLLPSSSLAKKRGRTRSQRAGARCAAQRLRPVPLHANIWHCRRDLSTGRDPTIDEFGIERARQHGRREASAEQRDLLPDRSDKEIARELRCSLCVATVHEIFLALPRRKKDGSRPREYEVEDAMDEVCLELEQCVSRSRVLPVYARWGQMREVRTRDCPLQVRDTNGAQQAYAAVLEGSTDRAAQRQLGRKVRSFAVQ
jgi:hypothetical protein